MRRKVKFQGLLSSQSPRGGAPHPGQDNDDDDDDSTSIGLNSIGETRGQTKRNNNRMSGSKTHAPSLFQDQISEDDSAAWTLSSTGYNQKLYGRENELVLLQQAYRRLWTAELGMKPTNQLVLISGSAGTGKTALAMSLRREVKEDGGFFITGKFDQMQSSELYSAFVSAFTELVDQVICRGSEAVKSLRRSIQSAVHTEQKMLTDMIPALEKILGRQRKTAVKEFRQSSDEVSCFKFVFRMFMKAISSPEFPLVFLLDDLHFADEASMELLQSLVSDFSNDGVLFIGTYSIEKPSKDLIQEYLKLKAEIDFTHITLTNLPAKAVDQMVAEVFSVVDPTQIRPLTNIIYRQTSGNVFYIREFLRYLQDEGLLSFDEKGMEWVWDERKIQNKIDFRRSVELMTLRLLKLPKATREVLEVASCLGSKLDENLLNRISPRPVYAQLQKATSRGFLHYDENSETFCFAHDLMQEAAYKLISHQEREAFHLTVGRELWKSFDDIEDLEKNIFIILGQIREGADLITYQEERNDVAALCLRAGELAICSSSFQTASEYLLLGVSMLGESCWEDEYELSLELYNAAAEVEYSIASFENVEKLVSEILANTRWLPDTLRAHSIRVYSLGNRGHMLKAIEKGMSVLELLNEKFPTKTTPHMIAVAVKKTKWLVRGKSSEYFLRLPTMDNPEKLAAMQMMNVIFLYAYIAAPRIASLIACRMVKLTVEYGLCDVSCVGFVTFAMLLSGSGHDYEEAFQCGEIATSLYDKFDSKAWLGRVSAWFYGSVYLWKRPVRQIFEPMKRAHRIALESGDIDFAMLNANTYCWESFDISSLKKMEKIVSGFSSRMEVYGEGSVLMMIKPLWQMVHNFMGKAEDDPRILTGQIMEQDYATQYARENNKTLLIWIHFYRMLLSYMFGDYESADIHASVCRLNEEESSSLSSNPFGSSDRVLLTFYSGLVALSLAQEKKMKKNHRAQIQQAKKCIKVFKVWGKQCPENFLGKLYFLEAELAAATGDHKRAHSKYTSAISLSREGGYILQHALANERAGKYFLSIGDMGLALSYLKEAMHVYSNKWGSITKCEQLRQEIPFLMS